MKQIVRGDRQLTVQMIADELEINRDSVWKIITEDLCEDGAEDSG